MSNPLFSILFSTRNRADLLHQTLEGISRQSLSQENWQVIVIDNGSRDRTPEVLADWAQKIPLIHMVEPVAGKNRALNKALTAATGDLYLFIDDDILPDANWLLSFSQAVRRWPSDAVFGGAITPLFPPKTPDWIRRFPQTEMQTAYADYHPAENEGPVQLQPFGGNMLLRAQIMKQFTLNEQVGPSGNSYAMGSETELLLRMKAAGYRFIYVPSANVQHLIRPDQVTVKWLYSRARNSGRGSVHFEPDLWNRRVLGVPIPLLEKLVQQWGQYMLALNEPLQIRFDLGRSYFKTLGMVHEYWLIHAKRKASRNAITKK